MTRMARPATAYQPGARLASPRAGRLSSPDMKRSTVETAAGVSLLAGALLGCASGAVTGMWGAGRDTIAFIKTYRNKAVARLKRSEERRVGKGCRARWS